MKHQYLHYSKIFFSMPPHVHIVIVVPPPGCGRSVIVFWGWCAHSAQLRCSDYMSDNIHERGVPGGALNLNSTGYQDNELPLREKIPTAELGIEPRTSWLVVRSSDHQATRRVTILQFMPTAFCMAATHFHAIMSPSSWSRHGIQVHQGIIDVCTQRIIAA
jgi:hypothetical protein